MVTAYFWEKETGYVTVLEQDPIYIKQGMSVCKLPVTMVCNVNSGFKFSLLNDFCIIWTFYSEQLLFLRSQKAFGTKLILNTPANHAVWNQMCFDLGWSHFVWFVPQVPQGWIGLRVVLLPCCCYCFSFQVSCPHFDPHGLWCLKWRKYPSV